MENVKYCVLWIPTKHLCFDWAKISTKQLKIYNISDNGEPFYISVHKQENSNNIEIRHHSGRFSKKIVCSINLYCINATPNGLFLDEYFFVSSHLSIGLGLLSFYLAILSIFLGIIALPSAYSSIFSKSKSIDDVYDVQKTLLYNDSIQFKNIERQNIQLDTIDKHIIQLYGKKQ